MNESSLLTGKPETTVARKGKAAAVPIDPQLLPERFLVVSNRLPYQVVVGNEGFHLEQGMGGLVTALDPIMRLTGGDWIGWTGSDAPVPENIPLDETLGTNKEYQLRTLSLDAREVEEYYLGYSNRCLRPLFHYFQEHCEFNHRYWRTYREVNQRFADAIITHHRPEDVIWIHDYHLLLVPRMVRERIPDATIGFFLHIPFPSPEVFGIENHAEEILSGLLGADLIGFHTDGYAANFMRAVEDLTPHRFLERARSVELRDRRVKLCTLPISIDCDRFARIAGQTETEERAREIRNGYRADIIAIGVDRLDYTKGILERLEAIELMLDRHPEIQGRFTFVQISAPSRTKVHAYREMREQIEGKVGRVNGRFGGRGCIPIDYRYEGHSQEDLVAYYRAADLAIVTPLRDGMNLVAKEYVVSQVDDDSSLVLSRFAGAADELKEAVLVNPYHPESTAEGIHRAITMPADERRRRMGRMREVVRRNDIYWWLERFLRELRDVRADRRSRSHRL